MWVNERMRGEQIDGMFGKRFGEMMMKNLRRLVDISDQQ